MYTYKGRVIRVVNADTIEAVLDLGFNISFRGQFQIANYDGPETWRPETDVEKVHGQKATKRAEELLDNQIVVFKTSKDAGMYGRYGAMIELPNGHDYGEVMISEGYSKRETYGENS